MEKYIQNEENITLCLYPVFYSSHFYIYICLAFAFKTSPFDLPPSPKDCLAHLVYPVSRLLYMVNIKSKSGTNNTVLLEFCSVFVLQLKTDKRVCETTFVNDTSSNRTS